MDKEKVLKAMIEAGYYEEMAKTFYMLFIT